MKDKWGEIYHKKVSEGWDNGAAMAWADLKCKERDHITDKTCWCNPELDYVDPDTGDEVWVHRDRH